MKGGFAVLGVVGYAGSALVRPGAGPPSRGPSRSAWGVGPGTPAAEAGFESGDRLVRFGDREVVGLDVVEWIRNTEPGTRVEVVVERHGTRKTLAPVIGDRSKL